MVRIIFAGRNLTFYLIHHSRTVKFLKNRNDKIEKFSSWFFSSLHVCGMEIFTFNIKFHWFCGIDLKNVYRLSNLSQKRVVIVDLIEFIGSLVFVRARGIIEWSWTLAYIIFKNIIFISFDFSLLQSKWNWYKWEIVSFSIRAHLKQRIMRLIALFVTF